MNKQEIIEVLKKRKQSDEDITAFLKWLKVEIPDRRTLEIYYGEYLKMRYAKRAVINHRI